MGIANSIWPKVSGDNASTGHSPRGISERIFEVTEAKWWRPHIEDPDEWYDEWASSYNNDPVIDGDGDIYCFGWFNSGFYGMGVKPDGTIKWTQFFEKPAGLSYISMWKGSTAVDQDNHLIVTADGSEGFPTYQDVGVVFKVNGSNGDLLWMVTTPGHSGDEEIWSPPVIHPNGLIIVAAGYIMYALNPADGSVNWWRWCEEEEEQNGGNYHEHFPSIGPVTGNIYICTFGMERQEYYDEDAGATFKPHVLQSINPSTGALVWEYPFQARHITSFGWDGWYIPYPGREAAPSITSDERIVVNDGRFGFVFVLDSNGNLLHEVATHEPADHNDAFIATGSLSLDEKTYYMVGYYGRFAAVDIENGAVKAWWYYNGYNWNDPERPDEWPEPGPQIESGEKGDTANSQYALITASDGYVYFLSGPSRSVTLCFKVNLDGTYNDYFIVGYPPGIKRKVPEEFLQWGDWIEENADIRGFCIGENNTMYFGDRRAPGLWKIGLTVKYRYMKAIRGGTVTPIS